MRRLLKQKCTCRCNLCSVNRTNEMATIISYRTCWDHFLYFYCIQLFGSGWKLLLRSLYLTCGAFCDHKMKPFDLFFFVITWHIIESCSSHYPPCLQGPLIGLIRVLGGDYKSLPRHDMREERREKRRGREGDLRALLQHFRAKDNTPSVNPNQLQNSSHITAVSVLINL